MKTFEVFVLSAAAMLFASACSNSAPTSREALGSQTLSLATADASLAVPTATAAMATPAARGPLQLTVPIDVSSGLPMASATQLALGDANELAKLRSIGLTVASNAGVSSPKAMQVVAASDHQAVEFILSGAILDDHVPVYVIKMSGGPFTARRHPPGASAPQGNFLTATVDATTHRVTDVSYLKEEPDLSKIGSASANL